MFSLQVLLGLPLFLLLPGTQSSILLGHRSAGNLWTWPYHMSLFILIVIVINNNNNNNNNNKHQGLDPLTRCVSRVTAARANASSVYQLFSFPLVCSGMISKGFGFVSFFASVKASSVFIHLSCLVCL